jgi:glycosyltransferase involved in cell wall biosynthesis
MAHQVVVFVGVLTEYQGIDLLLQAIPRVVRRVPEVKFLVIGYPNEEQYRDKATALGVEKWVHFTGKISYEDVPRYLSLADVAVSPKISESEANLKLFAYMAMGLPTVVFDSPINREILGDAGVYAKIGDVESLAQALIAVLKDGVWAKQLGERGRQKATADYSWMEVGKRLSNIYDSIGGNVQTTSKEQADEQFKGIGNWRGRIHRFPFNKRAG